MITTNPNIIMLHHTIKRVSTRTPTPFIAVCAPQGGTHPKPLVICVERINRASLTIRFRVLQGHGGFETGELHEQPLHGFRLSAFRRVEFDLNARPALNPTT